MPVSFASIHKGKMVVCKKIVAIHKMLTKLLSGNGLFRKPKP
jgi:hypothetical protein